jgi:hypothetical protein
MSRYKMISIPEAQNTVMEHTMVLPAQEIGLIEALGKTLAQPIVARDSLPPFPASIKDGYAVVASDGPGEYEIVGESRAGCMDTLPLGPGKVAYITTGEKDALRGHMRGLCHLHGPHGLTSSLLPPPTPSSSLLQAPQSPPEQTQSSK